MAKNLFFGMFLQIVPTSESIYNTVTSLWTMLMSILIQPPRPYILVQHCMQYIYTILNIHKGIEAPLIARSHAHAYTFQPCIRQ